MQKLTCQQLAAQIQQLQQDKLSLELIWANYQIPHQPNEKFLEMVQQYQQVSDKCKKAETDWKILIAEVTDPYHYVLREKLAKKLKMPYIGDFHEGIAKVFNGEKWFYIDEEGNNMFPEKYWDRAGNFSCGYAKINQREIRQSESYLNTEGNIFTIENNKVGDVCNNISIIVTKTHGSTFFYFDENGLSVSDKLKTYQPLSSTQESNFKDGVAVAKSRHQRLEPKVFFINTEGEKIINEAFNHAWNFDGEKALVNNVVGGKITHYFIDRQGRKTEITIFKRQNIDPGSASHYSKNTTIFCETDLQFNKIHYFLKNDSQTIINQRTDIRNISANGDNILVEKKNGKYEFIDTEGNPRFNEEFNRASNFEDGVAEVHKNGRSYYINRFGQEIFKPT